MADIIFKDHSFKDRLESLVFPAVLADFYEWRRSYSGKAEYVILESAILLEKPIFDELKRKVMVVIAPEEIRIRRVLARDKTTVERVKERIAAQWSDERRKEISDFVIFADEKRPLLNQIISVDKEMKMRI
jgi:Dephospho-CoA kinase